MDLVFHISEDGSEMQFTPTKSLQDFGKKTSAGTLSFSLIIRGAIG